MAREFKVKAISVSYEEMNNILYKLDGRIIEVLHSEKDLKEISYKVYIYYDTRNNMHLYYKDIFPTDTVKKGYKRQVLHYKLNLYDMEKRPEENEDIPLKAILKLNSLARKYKENYKLNKDKVDVNISEYHATMYSYTNPKFPRNVWIDNCYGYDMNSCYPTFMKYPLPNGDPVGFKRIVMDNEIGFIYGAKLNANGFNKTVEKVKTGEYADIIFKSMIYKSFSEFATNIYELKKNSNEAERDRAKLMLNALPGLMRRHNIFIEAAITGYAKDIIIGLRDENTIMQRVDSIISSKPRTDLDIGEELGQFKEEHTNEPFIFVSEGKKRWLNSKSSIKGESVNDDDTVYVDTLGFYSRELNRIKLKDTTQRRHKIWPEYITKK